MLAISLLVAVAALSLGVVAEARVVTSPNSSAQRCARLAHIKLPNTKVYVATQHGHNTTFSTPDASPDYSDPVPNLPAFCRFGAEIQTSATSKVRFEVWLPEGGWSGRFAMVGNNGDAGGINYPDMGIPLAKYKFAVASTDTGHNASGGSGTFAINNPEAQIDFGYRAVHLTATYSKEVVRAYYGGSGAKHSYWIGCSSGGKQGLKELQKYPETFDGVLAGAAAQWWSHLNAQIIHLNLYVNKVNSTGYLTAANYQTIGAEVLKQCDVTAKDKLKDGIITDPTACNPRLEGLLCSHTGSNKKTCLHKDQIKTMYAIWADWKSSTGIATGLGGTNYFPGYLPGAEGLEGFYINGDSSPGPATDYFNYQVLNKTSILPFVLPSLADFEKLVKLADQTDPGQTNAIDANIRPFLNRGKLMTYVGLADTLIPSGSSFLYYERVKAALGPEIVKSFRLFGIPGMSHCGGGPGAWNLGAAAQRDLSLGGALQSETFDAQHDLILALIAWIEKHQAPNEIIGARYVDDDKRRGVAFERKMCVWPKLGYYEKGDPSKASSFVCR